MYDTRVLPIGAAGTGIFAWTLPGGFQIAGIKVDNNCGSWLALPDGSFVPPYTLGWGHSFQPTLASINILFTVGPASQLSTQQGDKPVITIYSEPAGESPGMPSGQGGAFVEQFTPVITGSASVSYSASLGMTGHVLFPAVANKRYRILTVRATQAILASAPPNPTYNWDNGQYFVVYSSNLTVRPAEGRLNLAHLIDNVVYPLGLDCPIGDAILCDAVSDWGNNSINIVASAMLI